MAPDGPSTGAVVASRPATERALLAVPGLGGVDPVSLAAGRALIAAPDATVRAGSTLGLLLPSRARARRATVRRAIDIRVRSASGGRVRRRSGLELDAAVTRGESGAALVTARFIQYVEGRNTPNPRDPQAEMGDAEPS